MDLSLQLQTFKKGDLIIKYYIFRIKIIHDHLTVIGYSVPDHDLVFFVLEGLDSNWNSFIYGITLRPTPIMLNDIYGYLLAREMIFDHQFGNNVVQENITKMNNLHIKAQDNNKNGHDGNNNNDNRSS